MGVLDRVKDFFGTGISEEDYGKLKGRFCPGFFSFC